MARRGILFVLSGASGVGKGTILSYVLSQESNLHFSVSWTTRERRAGEIDAKDYFFKSRQDFDKELNDGSGFLEYAEFVGNLYGTPRGAIEERLAAGSDVILDVELVGAINVAKLMPEAKLVLVVPPNISILRRRLLKRGTDALPVVEKRLKRAVEDMTHYGKFDYVIVNRDLLSAVNDLEAIIHAERLRSSRIDPGEFKVHSSRDPSIEPDLDRLQELILRSGVDLEAEKNVTDNKNQA
jgi:guanylate kinase